jgi:hypothetical protein
MTGGTEAVGSTEAEGCAIADDRGSGDGTLDEHEIRRAATTPTAGRTFTMRPSYELSMRNL